MRRLRFRNVTSIVIVQVRLADTSKMMEVVAIGRSTAAQKTASSVLSENLQAKLDLPIAPIAWKAIM